MSISFSRITLIAQRGRREAILVLRRRGSREMLLLDGQLVCSRAGKLREIDLGPAAESFDGSLVRDAIAELFAAFGGESHLNRQTAEAESRLDHETIPLNDIDPSPAAGLVAVTCERCGGSMIYQAFRHRPIRLCPPCYEHETARRLQRAASLAEQISSELTKRLDATEATRSSTTLDPLHTKLRDLEAAAEEFHDL